MHHPIITIQLFISIEHKISLPIFLRDIFHFLKKDFKQDFRILRIEKNCFFYYLINPPPKF